MSNPAFISLSRVSKSYDGAQYVVDDLNLDVSKGEFLSLLGPSGSGKTTTLMMLAGFETPTHGEIRLDGRRLDDKPPHQREIGMVFQNYALFPHLNALDNVAFSLKMRGVAKDVRRKRAGELLELVAMSAYAERKPAQLSGGQQQRVALARTIAVEPKLLLLDEPLSNLDAKLRIAMRVEIRKLQRRLSTTSIYVTHDQLEAMTLADILVVMNGGQVEQIGNPLDIYQKPATTFVASFIGAPPMNLMPLRSDELKSQLAGDTRINEAGILGIRPEDFVITNETVSGGVALDLTVEAIERVGAETFIYGARQHEVQGVAATPGELPPGEVIVRIPGAIGPAIGERIRAAAAQDKLHLFTADGRKRVGG
jgi:sn-glycerol 3-phosphate transport system ATP-binding protein